MFIVYFVWQQKFTFLATTNQLLLLTAKINYVLFEKQKGWYTNEIVGHNGCLLIIEKNKLKIFIIIKYSYVSKSLKYIYSLLIVIWI